MKIKNGDVKGSPVKGQEAIGNRENFAQEQEIPKEKVDNYEVVRDNWRKIYLEMDRQELKERFHLQQDERGMYILYYGQRYCLDEKTGAIFLVEDPSRKLVFNTVIAIYNLFYYAKKEAKVCGRFVPYRQVKRAAPFAPAFQKRVLIPLAKAFEGHEEALRAACEKLGGTPASPGDVSYIIPAFDCMPVQVCFWDGDEEFEAQANILFDADITDFLHEETVVCVGSDLVRRLCEEADLQPENLI